MSLIGSLLAFVLIIPLKARPEPVEGAKPKEVENLAVMALADEVRRLQFALDHWRNAGSALMEENERLREENRRLRQEEAGRQLYSYVGQQASQAQMNAQMAQQMQLAQYQGLQQAMQQNAYAYCNCVPSRAQAFDNENTHQQEG